ncbi:MAG: BamA/TamA family outer membrane protein [Chitinophagaceae bacterium]|nr:BamA/TamA family outer membrane protein [Chitinophagaceae bacterium]MCW5925670.1 BamA/TamA family outer membrane protein [Chitinophagaceae bacterium]
MMKKILAFIFMLSTGLAAAAQDKDSVVYDEAPSRFDNFMKKGEALFRILPVPMYSYSSEAGNVFGVAKFNLFRLSKKDVVSYPSKLSGVFTISTKGRINASVANEMIFQENKYIVVSYLNYKKQPEYIFGVGNSVKIEDIEQITQDRFVFSTNWFRRIKGKIYAGALLNVANYFNIRTDTASVLVINKLPGLEGGTTIGTGIAAVVETRDNRYNPSRGTYVETGYTLHFGDYAFRRFHADVRKYFTPFSNRIVLAVQTTTTHTSGEVPFYELSMLGGDSKMRGYYQGALRDKTALDGQIELRVPIWNIFGLTAFAGAGQVAPGYRHFALNDFWLSYGGGLRIKVDTRNDTNLRLDVGFGPGGISSFYINFAEAF